MTRKKIPEKNNLFNKSGLRASWIILAVLCCIILAWHTLYWYSDINDDAYITFRYARNAASGKGIAYNPGENLEGYSNFLWMLLLAQSAKMGFMDLGMAAKIMGLLFSFATLMLTPLLFRRLYPALHPAWAFLPSFFLASNPYFASWTTWGLEVPLYTLLLLAAVLLYTNRIHDTLRGSIVLMMVFLALGLTRPEGIMFLLVPMAGLIGHYGQKSLIRKDLRLVIMSSLIFMMYLFWKWHYFGDFFPNTYFAKVTSDQTFFDKPRGQRYVTYFFFQQNAAYTFMLLFCVYSFFKTRWPRWQILLPLLTGISFAWYVNGDWMENYRFLVPILPFLYIVIFAPLIEAPKIFHVKKWACAFLGVLIIVASGWHLLHGLGLDTDSRYSRLEGSLSAKNRKTWLRTPWNLPIIGFKPLLWEQTRWFMENAGVSTLTAFPDIGFFGYITGASIYDTQALVNHSLSHLFYLKKKKRIPVAKQLAGNLMDASPDYVFLRRSRKTGTGVNALEKSLLSSEEFAAGWTRQNVFEINDRLEMLLYVKNDAPGKPADEVILERYRDAIRWNPRIPYLYAGLINQYQKTGRTADAKKLAWEAQKRFPYARSFRSDFIAAE